MSSVTISGLTSSRLNKDKVSYNPGGGMVGVIDNSPNSRQSHKRLNITLTQV